MNSADIQLLEQIQQATRGGSRVLCTLARRGKAIERDEPARAQFLLSTVRSHPFYKGGRLAFDMLEIEDLMLDDSVIESISDSQFADVRNAGIHKLVAVLQHLGLGTHEIRVPVGKSAGQTDLLGRTATTDLPEPTTALPRVSFGSPHGADPAPHQGTASDDGMDDFRNEPELKSSDYLYDYVVLGFLDAIGPRQ